MIASDDTKNFIHYAALFEGRVPQVNKDPIVLASFRDLTCPLVLRNGLDITELVPRHRCLHLGDAAFTDALELRVVVVVVLELLELVEGRVFARVHLLLFALGLLLLDFGLWRDDALLDEDIFPLGGLARRRVVDVPAVAHSCSPPRCLDYGFPCPTRSSSQADTDNIQLTHVISKRINPLPNLAQANFTS